MRLEKIRNWYIEKEKIYFASIELTQNCNFGCKHCYCTGKNTVNLSLEQHYSIIDKIYDTGCLFINFTGGEIFTNNNFREIYTYAKNKGFIIDLLTNASLIDEKTIELFCEMPPNNIAITLYGANEGEYRKFTGDGENYKKVMNALELLKHNNIHFVLRTVAVKTFQESLKKNRFEQIAKIFDTTFKYDPIIFPKISGEKSPLNERLDVDEIIKLENCNESRKAAWKKMISSLDQGEFYWRCNAGVNSLVVDYQGNAFVCGLYRKRPISLLNNDIDTVIEHLREVHQYHCNIVKNNECALCEKRKICKWCPAYSEIFNGNDYTKIDYFCQLAEERMRAFK